jgi:SNF2 family DNA or RNA helicase
MQDRKNALAGIDILRKLCNHPDLLQRSNWESSEEYGSVERSGKLIVAMKVHHLPPPVPSSPPQHKSGRRKCMVLSRIAVLATHSALLSLTLRN